MKFHVGAFAHAVAVVWTVLYVLCALLIVVIPKETVTAFGYIMHADLTSLVREVTWNGFFTGLVVWYALAAVSAASGAWLYNRLLTAEQAVSEEPRASYGPMPGGKAA
jgi:tryptophan-rich sensory protein